MIGALWQAITTSVLGMIVGRSIVGVAVGGASLVVPMFVIGFFKGGGKGSIVPC